MASKKVSDLNKEELLIHMQASREINRFDSDSVAWQRAFELYRLNQGVRLDMDCSSCKAKVKEWLRN